MNKLLTLAGMCIILASCKNNTTAKENAEVQYKGDTIIVAENSPILTHMVVGQAQLKDFSPEFKTVGTVRPVSGRLAEIAPPFAGRVKKSFVQLGQKVGKGTPVFELGASGFYEATKAYFAAKSANELAQRNYTRQKELEANGVAARKDLEQAQSEAEIAAQEFEQAQATLNVFNVDVTSLQMGQPLKVFSPVSGEVVKNNIILGDYVTEDSGPLVVIADLSDVWVAALVKENYFGAIRQGDRVEVIARPGKMIMGTIHYVGEMLDEETRSLEVIVECDNTDRNLKLGMFCEVHFLGAPTNAIILPSTAIMQEQGNDYVLIELAPGKFTRRVVTTESVNPKETRIVNGVTEGENVVVKGGIYLNI